MASPARSVAGSSRGCALTGGGAGGSGGTCCGSLGCALGGFVEACCCTGGPGLALGTCGMLGGGTSEGAPADVLRCSPSLGGGAGSEPTPVPSVRDGTAGGVLGGSVSRLGGGSVRTCASPPGATSTAGPAFVTAPGILLPLPWPVLVAPP